MVVLLTCSTTIKPCNYYIFQPYLTILNYFTLHHPLPLQLPQWWPSNHHSNQHDQRSNQHSNHHIRPSNDIATTSSTLATSWEPLQQWWPSNQHSNQHGNHHNRLLLLFIWFNLNFTGHLHINSKKCWGIYIFFSFEPSLSLMVG